MKNKKRDTLYCGVDKNKIEQADPILNENNFKYLHQFIVRRYMIHRKKDVQMLPAPWTTDPILLDFKFTNVRREHDRETKWLIKNVINNKKLSYEDKLMNCILYRMFNKSETLEAFEGHNTIWKNCDWEEENLMRGCLEDKLKDNPKYTFFTNAFLTCGLKVALGNNHRTFDEFMPMRIIKFARFLYNDGIIDKINEAKDQEEVFNVLLSYSGLGRFLAYQIFVDFTYIKEFPFSENEFTVSGPGCNRGLDNIFVDRDGMTYEEALFWLRDNIDEQFKLRGYKWNPNIIFNDLPQHDRYMNVMSLENCHCEISKYIRAVEGTGRPKNKYRGGKG